MLILRKDIDNVIEHFRQCIVERCKEFSIKYKHDVELVDFDARHLGVSINNPPSVMCEHIGQHANSILGHVDNKCRICFVYNGYFNYDDNLFCFTVSIAVSGFKFEIANNYDSNLYAHDDIVELSYYLMFDVIGYVFAVHTTLSFEHFEHMLNMYNEYDYNILRGYNIFNMLKTVFQQTYTFKWTPKYMHTVHDIIDKTLKCFSVDSDRFRIISDLLVKIFNKYDNTELMAFLLNKIHEYNPYKETESEMIL